MGPLSISVILGVGVQLAKSISLVTGQKFTKEGWHGLSQQEKEQLAHKALQYAFENAYKYKTSPKEIFWNLIAQHIYRENEKTYAAWFMKNQWLINSEFIPYYEKKFGLRYEEIPKAKPISNTILSNQNTIIYGLTAVILLFVLLFILKKKK